MRDIKTIVLVASIAFLSACASHVKLTDPVADDAVTNDLPQPKPINTCCGRPYSADPLDDPRSIPASRSIYFDYDGYIVQDEFKPLVEAHSKYLLSHKTRHVVITGNTDERGSREYNLALGQKRAESVRQLFTLYGVPDEQLEALTYGAEKPKAEGSDEVSWAENRRADIDYP